MEVGGSYYFRLNIMMTRCKWWGENKMNMIKKLIADVENYIKPFQHQRYSGN